MCERAAAGDYLEKQTIYSLSKNVMESGNKVQRRHWDTYLKEINKTFEEKTFFQNAGNIAEVKSWLASAAASFMLHRQKHEGVSRNSQIMANLFEIIYYILTVEK